MDLEAWMEIYADIVDDLALSPEEDLKASEELSELLLQNTRLDLDQMVLRNLKSLINGRDCLVFGTSSGLESTLMLAFNEMEEWVRDENKVLIAADGAASILLSLEVVPDVIVTDMDGGVEDQLTCERMGSIILVHAHGDNMDVIRRTVPRMSGRVLGTTQIKNDGIPHLLNFGGFTDGDRAVMIADEMGAKSILLIGFDLEIPGDKVLDGGRRKWLESEQIKRKKKKLAWAKRIIGMSRTDVRFY